MSTNDCLFCKMVTGKIPVTKIYEDEVVLSFLDIGPISDGHTLVISKQHFEKLHECPAELLGRIFSRIGRIAVSAAMDSDGYNILCNNGRAAGQLIEHLHFHIVPRNTGDGLFKSWPSFKYKEGKIDVIAEAIREHL
jgi:histidine triad (HIT) family protein